MNNRHLALIVVFTSILANPNVGASQDPVATQERSVAVLSSTLSIHGGEMDDAHDSPILLILAASSSEDCRKRCDKAYAKCNNRPNGMKQCSDERKACYKKCK